MRLLSLLLLLGAASALAAAAPERPNILFVYTDDQRWDAMGVVQKEQGGHARFPWLKTPNMDRLAAEGVRFRNAFVTNSLCAPSRAVFLTGRYNHLNGIANNHTNFPENSVTYATLLRAAGYATGFCGKWHMGGQSGQRPGFDFSASFTGQGRYNDCPIEVNGKLTPSKGWVDDVDTDYAIQFMKEKKAQPFILAVAFKSTHGPCDPPPRAQSLFKDETAYSVPNLDVKAIYLAAGAGKEGKGKAGDPASKGKLDYFRCVAAADDDLGRLLATLDELGLTEKTVVIFTTDNGYYLGEHGLGDKRTAYEESLRVPLIVRWPKHFPAGEVRDQTVLNIDFAPTFLDLAGLPKSEAMQGRSWVPLVKKEPVKDWRTAFFYEYFQEQKFAAPTVFAVRTETAKLIKYPGHEEWTELFDLKNDPYEIKNLAADPQHKELLESMKVEYERQAKLVDFKIPAYADQRDKAPVRDGSPVLSLDFTKGKADSGAITLDARGLAFVAGRDGKQAAHFAGQQHLAPNRSPMLNPAGGPWSAQAVVKAEKPAGVIVAHGGKSEGFSLYLVDGKPTFTVAVSNKLVTVAAKESVLNQWTRIAGVITKDHAAALYLDGKLAASKPLSGFIAGDPHDGLSIGDDTGSPVTKYPGGGTFQGLMESLQILSGEPKN